MNLFGTDGIRGNSSNFPFDNKTLYSLGIAIAKVMNCYNIFIIRDTRLSGKRIQCEIIKGLLAEGITPILGGVMPTASASYIVNKYSFSAAIVISASHNPYYDNGIKIFDKYGSKISHCTEYAIEQETYKNLHSIKNEIFIYNNSQIKENHKFIKIYENFVIKSFFGTTLSGKTIIIDCANGSASRCAINVLTALGAKVIALNCTPTGKNINLNCGAIFPRELASKIKQNHAFCGFAFDGDADRIVCIDENGSIKDANYFLASIALWLKNNNKLNNNILITSNMANIGLYKAMQKANIELIYSEVGDSFIMHNMKKYNASFGGEPSGHFIFKDVLLTGDGLLNAIILLSILTIERKTLSKFMHDRIVQIYPHIIVNKPVKSKIPLNKLLKSDNLINTYKTKLNIDGKIIVRYSGTEKNVIRIMVEGINQVDITNIANDIANTIQNEIIELQRKRICT
ncbi:MAG: hypothetical protein LBM05_01290 [Endomicrobium sp.]|jgi:phosphoglucosamine mutase|nr:hypothetical protein [Endomicrobium sp.]